MTGDYLSGRRRIEPPAVRREPSGTVEVLGASEHNLKKVDAAFRLGVFTCVTGVSGSGKSTLVNEILFKALANAVGRGKHRPGRHAGLKGIEDVDKVIDIDQSPIGRTPRSNPATYTKVFDHIRQLFAATPEAKIRGYKPGRFSFNVKGGRCEACRGGRPDPDRDALPAGCLRTLRGLQGPPVQCRDSARHLQGQKYFRCPGDDR